jgi:TPR repeat protein
MKLARGGAISSLRLILVSLLTLNNHQGWSEDFDKLREVNESSDYVTPSSESETLVEEVEEKDAKVQYVLGVRYALGDGVIQDYKAAVKWYRLSAEQGFADAQFNLGVSYARGEGVTRDHKEAAKWYRLAAEQGIAEAQFNFGLGYDNGSGGTQYFQEALKWYRAAAEQGFFKAQVALGRMYADGLGVHKNYLLAHMWSNIGAANGSEIGQQNRDRISERMSPSEISEAQKRARACVRNLYKGC